MSDIKDGVSNFCSISLNFGTCIYHTMNKLLHAPITPPPLHIFCFGRQSLDPGEVLLGHAWPRVTTSMVLANITVTYCVWLIQVLRNKETDKNYNGNRPPPPKKNQSLSITQKHAYLFIFLNFYPINRFIYCSIFFFPIMIYSLLVNKDDNNQH